MMLLLLLLHKKWSSNFAGNSVCSLWVIEGFVDLYRSCRSHLLPSTSWTYSGWVVVRLLYRRYTVSDLGKTMDSLNLDEICINRKILTT